MCLCGHYVCSAPYRLGDRKACRSPGSGSGGCVGGCNEFCEREELVTMVMGVGYWAGNWNPSPGIVDEEE
jgi:hypothetical protein